MNRGSVVKRTGFVLCIFSDIFFVFIMAKVFVIITLNVNLIFYNITSKILFLSHYYWENPRILFLGVFFIGLKQNYNVCVIIVHHRFGPMQTPPFPQLYAKPDTAVWFCSLLTLRRWNRTAYKYSQLRLSQLILPIPFKSIGWQASRGTNLYPINPTVRGVNLNTAVSLSERQQPQQIK